MISRKEISLEKFQLYHVFTRAVEKRKIFATEEDCFRFIFQMYAANVGKPDFNLRRRDTIQAAKTLLSGGDISEKLVIIEHDPLVNIFSFALVVDHNHFILSANVEYGISKYFQKLNGGFGKYYNLKHSRQGTLFDGRYKIVSIKSNFQLDAVLRYVNVKNPLDVYQPGWREDGLNNLKEALEFLREYQFSSFSDLFGERNSKILAARQILEKHLGEEITKNEKEFRNFIKDYLQKKLIEYSSLFFEE